MGKINITSINNTVNKIKIPGNNTNFIITDQNLRNDLKDLQISIDSNFDHSNNVQDNYPSTNDTWQQAIQKLYNIIINNEDITSYTINAINSLLNKIIEYESKSNTVTTLANIPVNRKIVKANINSNQSSVNLDYNLDRLEIGSEIHVICLNIGSSDITITLPTASPYILMNEDSAITLESGKYIEINFISDGTNIYVRKI